MDRFKFRVWFTPDYQEPEMIYDAEMTYDNRCQGKGSFYHDHFGEILEDKDCVVMQCTGLKDKNGKLIYESDILQDVSRVDKPLYIVSWIDCSTGFGIKMIKPRKYELYEEWHLNRSKYDYVLLGNLYENPELLEDNNG